MRTHVCEGTFTEIEDMPFIEGGFPEGKMGGGGSDLFPHRDGVLSQVCTGASCEAGNLPENAIFGWTSPQFVDIDNDHDLDLLLCKVGKHQLCKPNDSNHYALICAYASHTASRGSCFNLALTLRDQQRRQDVHQVDDDPRVPDQPAR